MNMEIPNKYLITHVWANEDKRNYNLCEFLI